MKQKKIRAVGAGILVALWLVITAAAWFLPDKEISDSERRKLAQAPDLTVSNLLSTKFMTDFEDYSLDQFPMRDSFRTLKSLFHFGVLRQGDNNEIYLADGYAAKLEFPLKQASLDFAMKRFQGIYDAYLKDSGCKTYFSVVPDKGYYLAAPNGYPAMDYDRLMEETQTALPWASHIDLTGTLSASTYYHTDTHWRQELLVPTAAALCNAMGVTPPREEDFTKTAVGTSSS